MTEKKYYCLNCECKMDCIVANLHSDEEVCLKKMVMQNGGSS